MERQILTTELDRAYKALLADDLRQALQRQRALNADLLTALEETLRDAEGYLASHGAGLAAGQRIRARCDQARAAIERARAVTPSGGKER